MRRIAITLAGCALMLSAAAQAQQQPSGPATVQIDEQQPIGRYLTDGEGRSLYLFQADSRNESTCTDDCATAWPPLLSEGEPEAGEGVQQELLGVIEREDGSQQVTYNGWPLYYFIKDQQPGDIAGQDVEGFGAEWYLVTPQGQIARAEGESEPPRG